ncbi:Rap/ran-GAP family protein [Histomonas meleagridis]|uniref:Rap/ran-GAP family protein n=1 Tax=Histomonas meleagridis TaxID=135588 RepID=UPI00355AB832|nr:Rap/ran-GAP family protein [Histomonas meleagridis]KAH0804959.1 Rap/ran-GAP family protein [Histomonas meleagridis]
MAIEENDQVDVSNIATSGHYRWNISCITSMISGNEPLNLELKFADGIELKDPTNSEKRIDIENKINQFYGEDYLNGINLPEINVDNNILEQINKIWDYDNKPLKPQTDFKSIENPAAAVVTALGLNDSLCPVGKEKKNLLELKQLVSNTGRNCFKVGVVYVGDNVFEQNDLFQTTYDETTPHFREFLNGLGWPVELVTHKFYNGGLSLSGQKDGKTSIYYADLKTELMFHVGPLLPTNKNDKQQITKKRHIGNDHIHIIWSENPKNYEISTITSQFNQAHIVIYPIDTCLFRVDVFWKPSMKWFGPLRTSLVCTKKTLPSLARSTSISAMTAFYRQRCKFFSMTLNNVYSMKAVRSEIDQYQEDSPINKTMRNLMLCTERGIPLGTEGFSSSSGMLDVKSISIG